MISTSNRKVSNRMSKYNIGAEISTLRKSKGITQEKLAESVGVTAQAVSRWESGGYPDVELLPEIADFFGVSIDALFGRKSAEKSLEDRIVDHIHDIKCNEDKCAEIIQLCWAMESGCAYNSNEWGHFNDNTSHESYSCVEYDKGFTLMRLNSDLQYFLAFAEKEPFSKVLCYKKEYADFFKMLGDSDFLRAMYLLNTTKFGDFFTDTLLIKRLNITEKKANEIITELIKREIVYECTLKTSGKETKIYAYRSNTSFIVLLEMAREMIHRRQFHNLNVGYREVPLFDEYREE